VHIEACMCVCTVQYIHTYVWKSVPPVQNHPPERAAGIGSGKDGNRRRWIFDLQHAFLVADRVHYPTNTRPLVSGQASNSHSDFASLWSGVGVGVVALRARLSV
jgi:hypothetical protein